MLTASIEISE